jgi:hypothetical protein
VIPAPDRVIPAPDRVIPAPDRVIPAPDRVIPAPDRVIPRVGVSGRPRDHRVSTMPDEWPQDACSSVGSSTDVITV